MKLILLQVIEGLGFEFMPPVVNLKGYFFPISVDTLRLSGVQFSFLVI